jgi:hydrogenase nickel incorporation protein HypB
MCKDCGCGQATAARNTNQHAHGAQGHTHDPAHDPSHDHDHPHDHDPAHDHDHDHPHEHPHEHGAGEAESAGRLLTIERRILARNDELAARNRAWLAERGVAAINVISSPGSGKTTLLERTLERLRDRVKCGVIVGDQSTDNDARRMQGKGAEVRQIETISSCHLEAERVGQLLPEVAGAGVKLLFIENVGNLICPAAFDLGESFKLALLSAAEGEDKPVKYPVLFSMAPVVVLTKMDLAPHLDWDVARCRDNLRRVRPGVFVFELSAKTGQGMEAWVDYLAKLVA